MTLGELYGPAFLLRLFLDALSQDLFYDSYPHCTGVAGETAPQETVGFCVYSSECFSVCVCESKREQEEWLPHLWGCILLLKESFI